jgi:flagellin
MGAGAGALVFQIGANNSGDEQLTITTTNLITSVSTPVIAAGIDTLAGAQGALGVLDTALGNVNTARATYGAVQNRFESVISNLQVASENTAAARSRIMDADFGAETAALTRAQILQQAGTAMLAQANAAPQSVLSLLRG